MRLPVNLARGRQGAPAPATSAPGAKRLTRLGGRLRGEDGFTIIEVMVATIILTIGLLTTYLMLAVAVHASSDVRQREEGVSLARQITEDARSIPYSQLSNSSIVTMLQGYPGLANQGSGSAWQLKRGGFWYTITAGVTYTSGGTNIKQFDVTVNWSTYQSSSHQFKETALVSRAGQDPGLQASQLQLATPPWGAAGITGTQFAPVVTSTGIASLQFTVSAPAGTTAIVWTLNGNKQTAWNGSAPGSGTTWTSAAWSLSGVSDGSYTVGAQAEDSSGVDGPAITVPVRLIRNVPSAPSVSGYGFNANLPGGAGTVAEIQWTANPEQNIVGYRIYHGSTQICQTSLTTANSSCTVGSGNNAWCTTPTACVDLSPGSTSTNLTYKVVALYYDASNTLQEGNATSATLTAGAPTAPLAPVVASGQGVSSRVDGTAYVSWTPSLGTTPVSFYRIYRDGNSYTNRYDTIAASTCGAVCSYHDVNRSEGHSYYITAVGGTTPGSNMAESSLVAAGSG